MSDVPSVQQEAAVSDTSLCLFTKQRCAEYPSVSFVTKQLRKVPS